MARIVNEAEYTQRRNEILDVAQRLIYSRGYEQVTVQCLIDEMKISKGAFYHYFTSKHQVLEALVERTMQEAILHLAPIVEDRQQPALAKLTRFFEAVARWKTARKTYLMALLRTWYDDKNLVVRQKMTASGVKWFTSFLAEIIQQGVREGVMDTPYPEHASAVAMSLMINLGDTVGALLLSIEPESSEAFRTDCLARINQTTAAYTHAIERVLGAPAGSILLFDPAMMAEWVKP